MANTSSKQDDNREAFANDVLAYRSAKGLPNPKRTAAQRNPNRKSRKAPR